MSTHRKAFTLIEALAASLILAASVVALAGLNNRALRTLDHAARRDTAFQVLDQQLAMIDYLGIDAFLEQNVTQGAVQREGNEYQWSVESRSEELDALYTLRVTVAWSYMGRRHEISARTRLNGSLATLSPTTATAPASGGQQ